MPSPDREVWEGVLAHLRRHAAPVCRKWFDDLAPLGFDGGALGVRAASEIHRDYLRREAVDAFNDAVRSVTGQLLSVRFLGPDDDWRPSSTPTRAPARPAPREPTAHAAGDPGRDTPRPIARSASERISLDGTDSLPINPDYAFDQFVEGHNNRLAFAAAKAVAEMPGQAYNPLFIHGGVGLGKTHLLQGICLEVHARQPEARIQYVSCEAFVTRYLEAVRDNRLLEFRETYRELDLLVIDDIHFLTKRGHSQEEFFHVFNALHQLRRQIILSSDAPPEDIPDLEARLMSRFKWGLVANIDAPDYETRIEILRRKAELRAVEMPDRVLSHIAQHFAGNVRELEGAIVRLQMQSAIEGAPISIEMARAALGTAAPAVPVRPTIDAIISTVAEHHHLKRSDILGKRRHKSVVVPRQMAMFIARVHTKHSLEEIGACFGGRDHTTVMHAHERMTTLQKTDPELGATIRALEGQILSQAAALNGAGS